MTDSDLELNLPDINSFDISSILLSESTSSSPRDLPRKRPPYRDEDLYDPNSLEYKKARKRRQNRESAARSRARKKIELNSMDSELYKLQERNHTLEMENASLKAENEMLKKELEFYRGILNSDQPNMKGGKIGPGNWLLVSLIVSVAFISVVMPSEAGTYLNTGKRKLLTYNSSSGLGWSGLCIILAGICAIFMGIKLYSQKRKQYRKKYTLIS